MQAAYRTNVYVDGFNLYYRSLKGTPYRWLDLAKLCKLELPHNQFNRIRYFTAIVGSRPSDPQQPMRQSTYLRALWTIPNLVRMALVNPPPNGPLTAEVLKTEEKPIPVDIG